jgi:hypothetical protein
VSPAALRTSRARPQCAFAAPDCVCLLALCLRDDDTAFAAAVRLVRVDARVHADFAMLI